MENTCPVGLYELLEVGNIFGFEFPSIQNKEANSLRCKIHNARKRRHTNTQEKYTFSWLFKPRDISPKTPEKGDQCCQLD